MVPATSSFPIFSLPRPVCVEIFYHLSPTSTLTVSLVCKKFREFMAEANETKLKNEHAWLFEEWLTDLVKDLPLNIKNLFKYCLVWQPHENSLAIKSSCDHIVASNESSRNEESQKQLHALMSNKATISSYYDAVNSLMQIQADIFFSVDQQFNDQAFGTYINILTDYFKYIEKINQMKEQDLTSASPEIKAGIEDIKLVLKTIFEKLPTFQTVNEEFVDFYNKYLAKFIASMELLNWSISPLVMAYQEAMDIENQIIRIRVAIQRLEETISYNEQSLNALQEFDFQKFSEQVFQFRKQKFGEIVNCVKVLKISHKPIEEYLKIEELIVEKVNVNKSDNKILKKDELLDRKQIAALIFSLPETHMISILKEIFKHHEIENMNVDQLKNYGAKHIFDSNLLLANTLKMYIDKYNKTIETEQLFRAEFKWLLNAFLTYNVVRKRSEELSENP